MDDRNAVGVVDDNNLQRLTVRGRSDEHRDVGIIGFEASPVVSQCMEHVAVDPHIAPAVQRGPERACLRLSVGCGLFRDRSKVPPSGGWVRVLPAD
jgi:hypothetical protein